MGVTGQPSDARRDYVSILAGTSQNVIGIGVAALATFGAQILITRTLGADDFGVVTVMTMAAFVLSFATRAGMDMAVLRDVAVELGQGRTDRIRSQVGRAVQIAAAVSTAVAVLAILFSEAVLELWPSIDAESGAGVVPAAALGLPFLALANVWLSATRGLKIMRYTLYVFWAGQPLVWILFMLIGWQFARTTWVTVLAYSLSWAWAALMAGIFWRKESRGWARAPLQAGALGKLFRYAGPRAPAALFAQLLFWTDLFVLTRFALPDEVGVYSAALRAGQILMLFLTSLSLMFSPYVADLHSRGERDRLDGLFKALTRWTLAATLPLFLLLAIAPDLVLRIFGPGFDEGRYALLILLAGQFMNVATGSVGFILIMVGRTGWDLVVYAVSLGVNLALAFWLCPRYGAEGAAIANAVTFAGANLARLVLVKRFVRIQPYDGRYARLAAPAVVAGAVMWALHSAVDGGYVVDLAVTVTGGLIAYAIAYAAVGLTPAERSAVTGAVTRLRGTSARG